MKTSPRPTLSAPHSEAHPGAPGFCKIVTFYEDFSDAARALRKFQGIVRAFSGGLPVTATSWSFDLLQRKELNSVILHDVTHADVVVVSTRGTCELPERVRAWIIMSMAGKRKRKPTVVALHEEDLEEDEVAAPLCASLKKIAYRSDATFQCSRDVVERTPIETEPPPYGERVCAPHPGSESAQFAVTENLRWWGIND